MKHTGGNWDPTDWPVYFAASNPSVLREATEILDHILVAINEFEGSQVGPLVDRMTQDGKSLFIDSGVYWLSTQHAKTHHMSMDQALALAPEDVDGFKQLFDKYVSIIQEQKDKVWGYIEIDQGGRANKIKTRAKLEKLGLRPIPVYHPFNDGWEYFDHLAKNYDRICFGNVVMADRNVRKRLVATAWERRRRYPHLWIHLLGMTPAESLIAFPANSCDSSTWIGNLRWDQQKTHTGATSIEMGGGFTYELAKVHGRDAPGGWNKATKLAGYNATMLGRTLRNIAEDYEAELGADIGMFTPT